MAATEKFVLVLRFGGTLNATDTNSAFGGESAWRERTNDVNDELQDIGCVTSVLQNNLHLYVSKNYKKHHSRWYIPNESQRIKLQHKTG
jgi:hypothetical protein